MVQRVSTVAFEGIEARSVDVQVQVAPGLPAFAIVGLPDKAVSEARERVRAALIASGLALPARRITVNLAPADLPKEGSHYDLPIALGLMAAIGAIPPDALSGFTVLGELGLDGSIAPVAGVLPAAIGANARDEDGAYFGGHVRPANNKINRRDRRLAEHQTGKRRVVVIMRERGGRTLPFVFKSEDASVVTIARTVAPGQYRSCRRSNALGRSTCALPDEADKSQ
jgi:hypothetical protein